MPGYFFLYLPMPYCPDCENGNQKMAICEVHSLVDGDERERLVKWCPLCNAFICDECRTNKIKRVKAAVICKARKIRKFIYELT